MGCFGAGTACFCATKALVFGLRGRCFDAQRTMRRSFSTKYVFSPFAPSVAAFAAAPFSVLKKSAFRGNGGSERGDAFIASLTSRMALGGAAFLPPTARGKAPAGHSSSAVGHAAVWAPGKAPLLRSLPARVGRNVCAGLCPERVRRYELRLYVADFPLRVFPLRLTWAAGPVEFTRNMKNQKN